MTETFSENQDNLGGAYSGTAIQNPYASDLESTALKQMAYDSNFAEDINMKMQIPQKLTVASHHDEDEGDYSTSNPYNNIPLRQNNGTPYKMEVPDRITVSVGDNGVRYDSSHETHEPWSSGEFLQYRSTEPLSLTTPPRKLTLAERNLDTLDIQENQNETSNSESSPNIKPLDSISNVLMERIVPEVDQNESMEELDDISKLRRQVFKLHRRITAIEKQHVEKSKRDVYVYAVTVAFWVINGWFLYSLRRPY